MDERLVFGYGARQLRGGATAAPGRANVGARPAQAEAIAAPTREPRDWAFTGLLVFTAVLFFRPQDQLPILNPIPFADISAILALLAMVFGRLGKGLPLSRITPELCGVAALGLMILLTAPFSVWPGGAIGTFTDVFAKVLLIYILMVNTLTTGERMHKFITLLVVASAYISGRAVFDYVRGVGLVENGRVTSAVGGMFQNPNDLALNMVAVLPLSLLVAIRAKSIVGRLGAVVMGLLMIGAVFATHSRGGFVGLAVMVVILGLQLARRRPAAVGVGALLLLCAVPFAPASYWERVASITDDTKDATGSREARRILLIEAWQTFLRFPVYGVGAGQFQNYNPEDRIEIWRETHNVVLQVAAEMGLLGLIPFIYLLWRAFVAGRLTRK